MMAEATDVLGILHQNLIDAGFSKKEIDVCMDHAKKGEWRNLLPMLAHQKNILLEQVYASEKQIDCLDFLTYRLNKEYP